MLVTGGSRGIGAACARLAAAAGYDVCISYRSQAGAAARVVEACRAAGRRALAFPADVGDEAQVVRLFAAVDAEFGSLACLVNNAGTLAPIAPLATFSAERIRRVLEVNVMGAILCAREAVRRMSTRQGGSGGSIVNISSAAAYLGSPNEFIDYAASKGAIDTLTLGLSKEVAADGIRVNAVRPGHIDTEMHVGSGRPARARVLGAQSPLGRAGRPEEVAEVVLWLASEAASYVTGSLVDCAGGR
jgi:NAD(P)-dependent dehydrogenase (short-subunit alcohol dehydrogenase family)